MQTNTNVIEMIQKQYKKAYWEVVNECQKLLWDHIEKDLAQYDNWRLNNADKH